MKTMNTNKRPLTKNIIKTGDAKRFIKDLNKYDLYNILNDSDNNLLNNYIN